MITQRKAGGRNHFMIRSPVFLFLGLNHENHPRDSCSLESSKIILVFSIMNVIIIV